MRRNESEGPDLTKIGCAEAVTERMRWEGFQNLENIGIGDPPDVAEDDDAKRMDSENILKRNRRPKPLKESEKIAGEGTPSETKEFWFHGTEFVDMKKFLERLRREHVADG